MTTELFNRLLHPWFLILLPVPFILLIVQIYRDRRSMPTVLFSDLSVTNGLPVSLKVRAVRLLPWMRSLALCLGVLALARPQFGTVEYNNNALGVDISMVLDVSGSMQQTDYAPNRLEAAKAAAAEFLKGRTVDRVSIVVFATSAALLCPPTMDMATAELFVTSIQDGMIKNENTAVGDGLALAVDKLKDSKAKSRVVILLTDGESNAGNIRPLQAAEVAKALNVKVYTIGVARNTAGRGFPAGFVVPGSDIGESTLTQVAELTGGKFFRATDEDTLRHIYKEIDSLEKSEIEVDETADYDERFQLFWVPGLILLGLEFFLRAFWLRRLP